MKARTRFIEDGSVKRLSIANGDVAPIQDGRGMRLRVEHGTAWVTQDRSTADIFLDVGESYRIERNGLTLVSAMSSVPFTEVTVEPRARTLSAFFKRFAARFVRARTEAARERSRPFIYPYY